MPIGARQEEGGRRDLTRKKKKNLNKKKNRRLGHCTPHEDPSKQPSIATADILDRGLYRAEVTNDWTAKPGYSWLIGAMYKVQQNGKNRETNLTAGMGRDVRYVIRLMSEDDSVAERNVKLDCVL